MALEILKHKFAKYHPARHLHGDSARAPDRRRRVTAKKPQPFLIRTLPFRPFRRRNRYHCSSA